MNEEAARERGGDSRKSLREEDTGTLAEPQQDATPTWESHRANWAEAETCLERQEGGEDE